MAILQTQNLKKVYGTGPNAVHALDGINLSVEKGEFVAVVGTSGSGKSTLLHMLGGLDRPTSGKVFVDGKDIFSLKEEALTIFRRRKIGFVFQSYNLVPVLNVYQNIVLPMELDGKKKLKGKKLGRPIMEMPDEFESICAKCQSGELSTRRAAEFLGVSHTTFYRRYKKIIAENVSNSRHSGTSE